MRLRIRKLQIIATACYLTVFFFLSLGSKAQSKVNISGVVTDDKGSPLSGASVVEKNTSNGVITNTEGRYTIKASANSALIISFTGYRTLESPLNGLTSLDVKLTQDLQQLDDVVVTGYGTQIRKEITSSVVTVNSKEFNKGNIGDPIQLLQGKVGGLQIGRAGGNPNQPFTIRLRGLNTLSGDPSPLIVIDGILGGALDALDPNDIASVEVLKDASAAAIYGARASAGVIIVTTKSGKGSSRPQITYTGQVSFDQIAKSPLVATPEQYVAYGGQDLGSKTDWLDEVTRTGVSQIHNVTFYNSTAGGFSYNVSLNYRNTNSIIDHSSSYEQLNARANLSQRFWQNKLVLSAVLGTTSRTEDQGYQQSLSNALYYNPTAPVYDSAGNFYETKVQDRYNPVAINEQNVRNRKLNRQISSFGIEIRPIKNLVFSGTYTLQRSTVLIGEYSAKDAYMGGLLVNGWARKETDDESYTQIDNTLTYNGIANKLKYAITVGNSYNYQNYQTQITANSDFITDEFSYNNLAAGQGINKNGVVPIEGNVAQPQNFVGSEQFESISKAYFIRANLNFDEKYFLSSSYRREGSSRFGPNNRWGNFWAVSGGLDAAQIFNLSADQLKLRAGYGVTGTLPNVYYGYISTLGLTSGGYANGQFISGITPATGYNPDLKWEEKEEFNVGIDFGFFKKLSGSIDYFVRNTKDLLNVVDVPSPPNQVTQQLKNVGNLRTKGIELQFSYTIKNNENFTWTVDGNFSTAKTILVEFNSSSEQTILRSNGLAGAVAIGGVRPIWTIEGEEIGQIYAQPFVRYDPNGDPIVLAKDKTEMVFSSGTFQDNAIPVAHALPKCFAGLGTSIRYKNFDVSIFFRGAFGHSLVDEARAAFENVSGIARSNLLVTKGEFDTSIKVPHYSTRYVEKASFVKLDNATIGYTITPRNQNIIRSIRIYATGQNLLTFTNYKGADPEVRYFDPPDNSEGRRGDSFTGNGLFPGIDRYITFPPIRTYTLGVNVNF